MFKGKCIEHGAKSFGEAWGFNDLWKSYVGGPFCSEEARRKHVIIGTNGRIAAGYDRSLCNVRVYSLYV